MLLSDSYCDNGYVVKKYPISEQSFAASVVAFQRAIWIIITTGATLSDLK